jgi:CheY-like chemotaxis protein
MANVLVVDDEEPIRNLIARWLKLDGFIVFEAPNGGAAVDVARKSLVHLIVMDVKLPDMTGFEAVGRIRALSGYAAIPVVCLTGLEMPIDVAHEAGCSDLLLKPVDRQTLINAVQRGLH